MEIFNIGLPEVLFILLIAVIIFGPQNMVKSARDAGAFLRKVTRSPYWKEVWATKRDLDELPKMLAKEAQLDQTIQDLNQSSLKMKSSISSTVTELIKEVDDPNSTNHENQTIRNQIQPPYQGNDLKQDGLDQNQQ
jgi:Sec-independent protein translocase protein TatA